MDAQLASGVSDEISTIRRESPVQFKQGLVIACFRRTDGLHILASDRTFPADHLFRPFRDGAPISSCPSSTWARTYAKLCFAYYAGRNHRVLRGTIIGAALRTDSKQSFEACVPKRSLGTRRGS